MQPGGLTNFKQHIRPSNITDLKIKDAGNVSSFKTYATL